MEKQILARMIDEILMVKDAKRLQIEVSDADVSTGINSVAQANNFDRKRLEAEVQKAGYSVPEYHEEIRRQIMEQRWLVIRAAGKIDPKKAPDATTFQALIEKQREAFLAELRGHAFIEVR
jgi:peptidyl-prolyl cis-trans isomerase SurA